MNARELVKTFLRRLVLERVPGAVAAEAGFELLDLKPSLCLSCGRSFPPSPDEEVKTLGCGIGPDHFGGCGHMLPCPDHRLKCWPGPFLGQLTGAKCYEVRKGDRAYQVGQLVLLEEFVPPNGTKPSGHTGRKMLRRITFITAAGSFGLPADVLVFGTVPA